MKQKDLPLEEYLRSTSFIDYEEDGIQDMIHECVDSEMTSKEKAIKLYIKVRDQWRYDPYDISFAEYRYKASVIAKKETGNCVEKSILLIACLRAVGIPSRLHLGKVKNHIAVERLTEKFGSNELTPHGMVNIYLNNNWLKASPAFNSSLCDKFKVPPLDFDGENDSFLQQYNSEGNLFMEYLDDYGYFEDVPVEFMRRNVKDHYPEIFDTGEDIKDFRL